MCLSAVFALGALIVVLNLYLAWIYAPVTWHLSRRNGQPYKHVSGIPLFGSLFIAISCVWMWGTPFWRWTSIVLMLVDHGGLHWFFVTMWWTGDFRGARATRSQSHDR